jgi:acyl-CoA dehydrogenase
MMNFAVSKNTRELLDRINHWSMTEVRPLAREADNLGPPPNAAEVIARCPIGTDPGQFRETGPMVRGREHDVEYNKSLDGGGDYLALLCMEELNVGDGWGWQSLAGNNNAVTAVRLLGTPEQIERWGDPKKYHAAAICMTEEQGGLDLSQVKTTAVKSGDGWILNGEKRFISHASYAEYMVVLAQTEPGSGSRGLKPFIVEPSDPGFEVTKYSEEKFGTRYYPASSIRFNNIHLPADRLLAQRSFSEFMQSMNSTRPFCVAISIGGVRGMIEYAEDWIKQNNRPVSLRVRNEMEDQFAQMRAGLDSVRRMNLKAGRLLDQEGQLDATWAHKQKAFAAPILERIAFRSMLLMGAEAWSTAHLMEKWYRDVKTVDIIEGTGNMHRLQIARSEYGRAAAS